MMVSAYSRMVRHQTAGCANWRVARHMVRNGEWQTHVERYDDALPTLLDNGEIESNAPARETLIYDDGGNGIEGDKHVGCGEGEEDARVATR
jgi:hypothetical protein